MENNILQMTEDKPRMTKGSVKWKVYFVIFLIIAGAGIYGYFWLTKTIDLRVEAEKSIMNAKYYDALRSSIESERNRCNIFIVQEQGDFGSFEYCKKFISWADSLQVAE